MSEWKIQEINICAIWSQTLLNIHFGCHFEDTFFNCDEKMYTLHTLFGIKQIVFGIVLV